MSRINKIIEHFKEISGYPSISSGKIRQCFNNKVVNIIWNLNDIVNNKLKILKSQYSLNNFTENLLDSPAINIDENIVYEVYSKNKRAVLYKNSKENKDEFIVHIYDHNYLSKSINLTKLDAHSEILKQKYSIGNFLFSNNESYIHYVAVEKDEKSKTYFETKSEKDKELPFSKNKQYKKDYGEQMNHSVNLVICSLDINKETIEVKKFVPSTYQIVNFLENPKKNDIFAVLAYKDMPYQLGLIYCVQRPSQIFIVDKKNNLVKPVGEENLSKLSPRFSKDGKSLIWLENKCHGAHMQCQRLMKCNLETMDIKILVDIVDQPNINDNFIGIHSLGLTENCWSTNDDYIIMTSLQRCQEKLLIINSENGSIQILDLDNKAGFENGGCVTLLDICDDLMLLKLSVIGTVPFPAIASLKDSMNEGKILWKALDKIYSFSFMDHFILKHEPSFIHEKFGGESFESILITKKQNPANEIKKQKLILCLHGGPHSAFTVGYDPFQIGAVEHGFSLLMVNYRGSWGYGQRFIESLMGNIGEMDVADCAKACEDVLKSHSDLFDNSNQVYLYGGSHGGYLTIQLAGRYGNGDVNNSFQVMAGSTRNPVVNLLSHLSTTDIPDWVYSESTGDYDSPWKYGFHLTNEASMANVVNEMLHRSPLAAVGRFIKCPLLILLGTKDKRVPPTQGMELYNVLKGNGIETEVHLFPEDCHPLGSVEAVGECYVRTIKWFLEH